MGSQISTIKAVLVPDGRKGNKSEKGKIGILSFEVANVMSKIMLLWQSLSEHEILRLRTEVVKAEGVLNLVSENEAVLLSLACMEKLQDLTAIAGAVARVGKRCQEPILHGFEHVYNDILKQNIDVRSWEYPLKDMEGKIKKMEQYIASTANLYQELEIMGDLEQAIRRLQDDGSGTPRDRETVLALEQKAAWHRQEIKYLRESSLWNRLYDKVVTLLARTVCTIHGRIIDVFGAPMLNLPQLCPVEKLKDDYPSPFSLAEPSTKLPYSRDVDVHLGNALLRHTPPMKHIAGTHIQSNGNSVLSKPATSSDPSRVSPVPSDIHSLASPALVSGLMITNGKNPYSWLYHGCLHSPTRGSVDFQSVSENSASIGGIHGLQEGDSSSAASPGSRIPRTTGVVQPQGIGMVDQRGRGAAGSSQTDVFGQTGETRKVFFDPKNRHLNAPASTLGGAALSTHYANVIIIIEKMIKFPHLISQDSRDDLYHMLPKAVRMALRSRLKVSMRGAYGYDAVIAADWKDALERILAWLTPLAHNMIRWQSEHNFEQQQCATHSNILLLQTLFFADLVKTEAVITELLVGLNYIWGHEKEKSNLLMADYDNQKECDEYLEWQF